MVMLSSDGDIQRSADAHNFVFLRRLKLDVGCVGLAPRLNEHGLVFDQGARLGHVRMLGFPGQPPSSLNHPTKNNYNSKSTYNSTKNYRISKS
jgi:hypothetical protein